MEQLQNYIVLLQAYIGLEYDLSEQDVKTLMRENLKAGSYKAWRKRVKDFSSRREN